VPFGNVPYYSWPWSSAAAHVAGRGDAVAEGPWLAERIEGWTCTWGEYLQGPEDDGLSAAMRLHESTGRPLGSESFVKALEALIGRPLLPGKPGRPKKKRG